MSSTSQVYAALLFLSGTIAVVTMIMAAPRRTSPAGRPLMLMLAAMTGWSWLYALHWLWPTWPAPFFWLDATYLGVVSIPGLVLLFALELIRRPRHAPRLLWLALLIEPALTLLFLATDPYHNLFYGGLRLANTSDIFNGGPWFWINVAYSYTLFLVSYVLLISTAIKSRGKVYRSQIGFSIAGLTVVFGGNFAALLGFHPLPGLDLTPILFTFAGLAFAISLYSFHMLDLVPVAKEYLLDQMSDGMIVVDNQGRVVEMNRSAATFFQQPAALLIGKYWRDLCTTMPDLAAALEKFNSGEGQTLYHAQSGQILDIRINPMLAQPDKVSGYLLTWRDVTRLKQVENELRQANEALRQNLFQINTLRWSLEEQVIRDPLTGLFNRRFLEDILPQEIGQASRLHFPLALLVIDIDHFKLVNDLHGHATGDLVLKQLSQKLEGSIRKGDWAVRFGGEEFLIIMVDTPRTAVLQRAEQLRREIADASFIVGIEKIHITVSIGISIFPEHGGSYDELFGAADRSLYEAKAQGRNRVVMGEIPARANLAENRQP